MISLIYIIEVYSMDIKMILTPIIGAAIGYSTNWLAIKMLFRPYTEKRILGMKVPFTPGLIPKERERVASSIGEVIEEYLLTDRVIIDELLKDTTKEHVLKFVNKNLYNGEGNINLKHILASEDNRLILHKIQGLLVDKILDLMKDNTTKQKIILMIKDHIRHALEQTEVQEIIDEKTLQEKYESFLKDEKIKDILSKYLFDMLGEENSIRDIIDSDIICQMKSVILHHVETLIHSVDAVLQNEKVKEKVVALIDATIKEKVGALGAMFVNAESVYQTIAEKSKENLQEEEVKEGIRTFISEKIDGIMEKPLIQILPDDSRENLVTSLATHLPETLSKLDVLHAVDVWEKDVFTIIDDMMDDSFEDKILKTIESQYEAVLKNEKTPENIANLVSGFLDKTLSSDLSISEMDRKQIDTFILEKYEVFIIKHITELIKEVKLGVIIEKQLNSFELHMLEDIILSIAKKELNAITLLGGLLGFIISLLVLL